MAVELPWDIITDILTRLPVKPLLRFRSVSKHFLTLIDSPDFIKCHLHRSLLTRTNRKLILRGRASKSFPSAVRLYSINLDQLDQTVKLNHYPGGTEILGSVNGLLCLRNGYRVAFWNFAARKYHKLPPIWIDCLPWPAPQLTMAYGFGYDSVADDYKLLRLVHFYGRDADSFHSEAKIEANSDKAILWRNSREADVESMIKTAIADLGDYRCHDQQCRFLKIKPCFGYL